MSKSMSCVALVASAVCLLTQAAPANAQLFGDPCCPTCCAPPPVTCMQPVCVPRYQTVPVTEYQPCEQTVMKPVCTTEYIDQPVTEYRPVTETRVQQVPHCEYQPVTEFIPQTRDCGRYCTFCQCCPRMSPCQYDPNPGLIGWLNRTGYEMRMAFTPTVTYRRQWVPNYITTQVPVTRMVAHQTVREVSYNITRLEPHVRNHRVAINKVNYVAEKIVTQRPITVFKTVPIGTSVAWVPAGSVIGGTATALGPNPDPISRRAQLKDDRRVIREAERQYENDKERFRREKAEERLEQGDPRRTELIVPQRKSGEPTAQQYSQQVPSAVRVAGWVARHRQAVQAEQSAAPVTVTVAKQ